MADKKIKHLQEQIKILRADIINIQKLKACKTNLLTIQNTTKSFKPAPAITIFDQNLILEILVRQEITLHKDFEKLTKNLKNFKMETYHPLSKNLDILPSKIDGKGLHAKEKIKAKTNLGITHVKAEEDLANLFHSGMIRTPLAGHLNHSENPNSSIVENGKLFYLITEKEIGEGEEITVNYRETECGCNYVDNF